jgi:hypothetical protein
MKKRDYYILAFLACLVIYAMLNRRSFAERSTERIDKLSPQNAEAYPAANDSLQTTALEVSEAGI